MIIFQYIQDTYCFFSCRAVIKTQGDHFFTGPDRTNGLHKKSHPDKIAPAE